MQKVFFQLTPPSRKIRESWKISSHKIFAAPYRLLCVRFERLKGIGGFTNYWPKGSEPKGSELQTNQWIPQSLYDNLWHKENCSKGTGKRELSSYFPLHALSFRSIFWMKEKERNKYSKRKLSLKGKKLWIEFSLILMHIQHYLYICCLLFMSS